jgi:hypothetical protein
LIERKGVFIWFILILILAILFGFAVGTYVAYLGVLIAGVISGFMGSNRPVEGVRGGIIWGLITGLLMALVGIIITLNIVELITAQGVPIVPLGIIDIIYLVIFYEIISAIGGSIGAMITSEA